MTYKQCTPTQEPLTGKLTLQMQRSHSRVAFTPKAYRTPASALRRPCQVKMSEAGRTRSGRRGRCGIIPLTTGLQTRGDCCKPRRTELCLTKAEVQACLSASMACTMCCWSSQLCTGAPQCLASMKECRDTFIAIVCSCRRRTDSTVPCKTYGRQLATTIRSAEIRPGSPANGRGCCSDVRSFHKTVLPRTHCTTCTTATC